MFSDQKKLQPRQALVDVRHTGHSGDFWISDFGSQIHTRTHTHTHTPSCTDGAASSSLSGQRAWALAQPQPDCRNVLCWDREDPVSSWGPSGACRWSQAWTGTEPPRLRCQPSGEYRECADRVRWAARSGLGTVTRGLLRASRLHEG